MSIFAKLTYPIILVSLFLGSCSLWEYEDPSKPYESSPPETYLSLTAIDTIYAAIDDIVITTDPLTGDTLRDTLWTYAIGTDPDTTMIWDTLSHAFTTITTSRQVLHWWGEDQDGDVIGYFYKWNVDTAWTYTTKEMGLFYVPIRTDLDVFRFEIAALDNDSLVDPTPAQLVLPIKNSPPTIDFRYRSNPFIADIKSDTSFTFPTRTFVWDINDQDGIETVTDIFYA
ncbi:MAG: hypothetical protein GXO90_11965, partial [FCB group bacterium]|nr:hypothetical protein [FCB group bacterium]